MDRNIHLTRPIQAREYPLCSDSVFLMMTEASNEAVKRYEEGCLSEPRPGRVVQETSDGRRYGQLNKHIREVQVEVPGLVTGSTRWDNDAQCELRTSEVRASLVIYRHETGTESTMRIADGRPEEFSALPRYVIVQPGRIPKDLSLIHI